MPVESIAPDYSPAAGYERVEKAIRFLAEHAGEQPRLAEVAGHVGLSPFHFQREFTAWAGLSPKEFLKSLTAKRARELLDDSHSLLDTALEVGLSGPSRLHDLFVSVEGMTPGEYKHRAAGLSIHWCVAQTPFGRALFAAAPRGLCRLAFTEDPEAAVAELARDWPGASLVHDPARLEPYCLEVSDRMRGLAPSTRLGLVLKGSELRLRVWRALLEIPRGTLASYAQVAALAGRADAVRAVAGGVAANPIAYLIPCHRVIRSTGALGGYHWGTGRKKVMLATEQVERALA